MASQMQGRGLNKTIAEGLNAFHRLWRRLNDDPAGKIVLAGFYIVAALIPLNVVQYKLLGWSTFPAWKEWLTNFHFGNWDSWEPMRQALAYARTDKAGTLYQEIFFNRHVKFQYAPTALLPLAALQGLGINTSDAFLNNLNRLLVLANALGVGFVFRLTLTRTMGAEYARSAIGVAGAIMSGVSVFVFYPVMMAFWSGQIQIWIDLCFTLACIAFLLKRDATAGVLVGFVCLLKPQLAVLALWALVRRRWRFMFGAAAVLIPCGLISLATFGLGAHLGYLEVLSFLSRHGEAMIANNSVNGMLNNWMGMANPLIWEEHGFPAYNPIVYYGGLLAAVLLVGASLWPKAGSSEVLGLFDFQAAALAYTMAAPIAWEHHYGILPPMFAGLAAALVSAPSSPLGAKNLLLMAGAFLLSAICITSHKYISATPLNLLHGYLFVAGLLVLRLLWDAPKSLSPARG